MFLTESPINQCHHASRTPTQGNLQVAGMHGHDGNENYMVHQLLIFLADFVIVVVHLVE